MSADGQVPSNLHGNVIWAKGKAEEIVGNVTGFASWSEAVCCPHLAGCADQQAKSDISKGAEEVEEARAIAVGEAKKENVEGKVQSLYGMVTGDKDAQNKGNVKAQKAEAKEAVNAPGGISNLTPDDPSIAKERVLGKLESAVGMATGDQKKQTEGNMRDATGEVKDTIDKTLS